MAEDLKLATMALLQLRQVAVQADGALTVVIGVPRESRIQWLQTSGRGGVCVRPLWTVGAQGELRRKLAEAEGSVAQDPYKAAEAIDAVGTSRWRARTPSSDAEGTSRWDVAMEGPDSKPRSQTEAGAGQPCRHGQP